MEWNDNRNVAQMVSHAELSDRGIACAKRSPEGLTGGCEQLIPGHCAKDSGGLRKSVVSRWGIENDIVVGDGALSVEWLQCSKEDF